MKIIKAETPDANAPHVKHKVAVLAAIAAAPASISFDALRTELALNAAALPDGAIAQIAQDAGIKVAA